MKFILIFFLFPLTLSAQDISGVWIGHLYNDTTKQNLHYELAINENGGKLSGFSHTTFVVDSVKKEIGVKSVTIKSKDGHYYVVDDKFVYDDYSTPPVKGIRVYCFLTLSENDTSEVLSGIWRTNGTKIYRPLTGTVFLEKKKKEKPEETLIVAQLVKLGLTDKLTFLPPSFASNNMVAINNKPNISTKNTPETKESPARVEKENNPVTPPPTAEVTFRKERKPKEEVKPTPVIIIKPVTPPPAAEITSRKIETIRTVDIVHDSLVFTLYDNGAVDGDTVSVVMNGKVVMPRVGLLERAINKTIYLTPDMGDSISVIMYAENLGSIPPNTGLLVVRDGDKNYEIRFTGDLKTNSEIILVRKKKK